jgi:beta-glucosidase
MASKWIAIALAAALTTLAASAPAPGAAGDRTRTGSTAGVAHPELWPRAHSPVVADAALERRIDVLLAHMSLEEKVGQILQPEFKSVTPEDVRRYHLGTLENGGGSTPGGNKRASLADWLKLIDAYYDASVIGSQAGPRIPLMWASDAVHGHNNVFGATLFPHNIGLGAMHDPQLIRRIGAATAEEVRATGMDWSFAPTLAVVRDDRWGRTYESYSENPALVAAYAGEMVRGLQGEGPTFLDRDHVISTAKHFLGDGGTDGGRDQGDNLSSEANLRDIHGAGYPPAVNAGVQAVMASFSSWQGVKMHVNKSLLTGVLKGRFGFDGLVIGDWNAHGQAPGCSKSDCPAAFNAGIDVFNVPEDWKALYANMVSEVRSGVIPMSRLDDAVRRVLRVKLRAGVFDEPRPSERPHAGDRTLLGSPAHRAVARQAVRESLVLLKNNGRLLPLRATSRILVAGPGADSLMRQTGGWTLSWQGNDNVNADFPGATSIWSGIRQAVEAAGGQAELSPDGSFTTKPDAAIVVFGETPYAEFQGDQADVALHADAAESVALMRRLKAQGVPVVAVLLSGRPLYLNPQINAADAFVAAWLPGSEGGGVADVLIAAPNGKPRYDFRGRLPFSWPKRPDQTPLNVGDQAYSPQFAFGYGLTYAHGRRLRPLVEADVAGATAPRGVFLADGKGTNGFQLYIGDAQAPKIAAVGARTATYGSESLTLRTTDRRRQGDARTAEWSGGGRAWVLLGTAAPADLQRETNGAMALAIDMRVDEAPQSEVALNLGGDRGAGTLSVTALLAKAPVGRWWTLRIPLTCFAKAGADLAHVTTLVRLETAGRFRISFSDVGLSEAKASDRCP